MTSTDGPPPNGDLPNGSGVPRGLRVFVNERGVTVPAGATALDALRAFDAEEAGRVTRGERSLTDSRGLPADANAPAYAGAIYRTVAGRRAASEGAP